MCKEEMEDNEEMVEDSISNVTILTSDGTFDSGYKTVRSQDLDIP